jgi:organic radical activating enzyme
MELHNIRYGFATNSSSSHSIVFLPEGFDGKNEYPPYGDFSFGWENFTLISEEAKKNYLMVMIYENLQNRFNKDYIDLILNSLFGRTLPERKSEIDAYIDHNSVISFPKAFGTNLPDINFIKEYCNFVMRKDVAILGGNDNDEEHPLTSKTKRCSISSVLRYGLNSDTICRKDIISNEWILFDQKEGTKIRFSFEKKKKSKKSDYPELVDLKITDKCPYGCPYCYQDSSPYGDDKWKVNGHILIDLLKDMKVFEVAIGGGEPTLHPSFMYLLRKIKEAGIIPNFSTKNIPFLLHLPTLTEILKYVGAIGISYDYNLEQKLMELKGLIEYNKLCDDTSDRFVLQAIIGPGLIDDKYEIKQLLNLASKLEFGILLLDFKQKGRGNYQVRKYTNKSYTEQENGWWIKEIKDFKPQHSYYLPIGIDTPLAKRCEKELKEYEISPKLYNIEEGKFSCYIDMVEGKIGPSSYCNENEMHKLVKFTIKEVMEKFNSF